MATEFDYKAAWNTLARPAFLALPRNVRYLFYFVCRLAPYMKQIGATSRVTWPPDEIVLKKSNGKHNARGLRQMFGHVPAEYLAQAGAVVHNYGHWFYRTSAFNTLTVGAYWKFHHMCEEVLADKGMAGAIKKWEDENWRPLYDKPPIKAHVEGTDLDNEELGWKYEDKVLPWFEVVKVENVNHRVASAPCTVPGHPFCIGTKHMQLSKGMYLDPTVAPCAFKGCGYPYEDHVSDRVMFLKCTQMVPHEEAVSTLTALEKGMESDKIDGFVFVENQGFTIEPKGEE